MRYSGLRYLNNVILEIKLNLPLSANAANNFNAEELANPERKCIFEVEKSMNPEVLACFSWFSHFFKFR